MVMDNNVCWRCWMFSFKLQAESSYKQRKRNLALILDQLKLYFCAKIKYNISNKNKFLKKVYFP